MARSVRWSSGGLVRRPTAANHLVELGLLKYLEGVTVAETNFSELINKPLRTVALLTGSLSHHLRLRRRDDVDLVLMTATRYDQDHAVVTTATRLFVALLRDGDAPGMMMRVLPEVFPWVRFLPDADRRQFLSELVQTLQAAEDLENLAPVTELIVEWRHTAEVHADPELSAALRQDAGDYGDVPAPDAA